MTQGVPGEGETPSKEMFPMTPDLWWLLGAGLVTAAMTLLFACLQVAGAASDAADRALARAMVLGFPVSLRRGFQAPGAPSGHRDGR